jgi:hypothetical protein
VNKRSPFRQRRPQDVHGIEGSLSEGRGAVEETAGAKEAVEENIMK